MPHQSDVAFMSWFMPTLNPASVEEYLAFGEYGYALSRFSGMWVGFKAISETVESARSVDLGPDRGSCCPTSRCRRRPPLSLARPARPAHRGADGGQDATRSRPSRAANPIDRHVYGIPDARYGIVTTGKGHLDLMEALRLLGLDEPACRRLGIDVYKVGMVWPLAWRAALDFVREKQEVLVVEEKRGIIESQLKEYFYDYPGPQAASDGRQARRGRRPADPLDRRARPAPARAARRPAPRPASSRARADRPRRAAALERPPALVSVSGATRTPYFCSGCPHNTSTRCRKGRKALAGIGCHFMATLDGPRDHRR